MKYLSFNILTLIATSVSSKSLLADGTAIPDLALKGYLTEAAPMLTCKSTYSLRPSIY